ncbi:hypothetical protein M422DRAFT_48538 [Sphaerobolus stellatus SS14]|uniref:3'-5' exonuclease domain-containing protein n=1 Tax=Sphaerobolus stellatus (strain SS14) TaxID=990650 RepID=A0A0C9VJ94_SPHS4|nr:hypothetical protein M422DRAFT_48538 [Sphaerobolus stellatus SS14]
MPSVPQNVIPGHPSISFDSYTTSEAGPAIARHFNSESSEAQAVGISTRMSTDGKVKSLVLLSLETAVVVQIGSIRNLKSIYATFSQLASRHSKAIIGGFHMSRITLHVARDFKIPIRGIDLGTLLLPSTWEPLSPPQFIKEVGVDILNMRAFKDIWDCPLDEKDDQYAILRAWMCS